MKQQIENLLRGIIHPETGQNIVDSGIVAAIEAADGRIAVTLRFAKVRDPFAAKIRRQAEEAIHAHFTDMQVEIVVAQSAPQRPQPAEPHGEGEIGRIIAVASGKGGVGKSTVTANLAVTLHRMGYRVGVLDADIYGPSQPKLFGVEGYLPEAVREGEQDWILPARSMGIALMSIGFFVKPDDALLWRGAMAVNALKQLIHQTKWGPLDVLLIDLPPGTGDIHLSIINELKIDAAAIVSTPQQVAVADVRRGVELFRNPQVQIPVAGVIENMAWFTPAELPDNRYYLFGRGGARAFAEECGVDFLGEIPIVQAIMEGCESGEPVAVGDAAVGEYYRLIAARIVDKVLKG